MENMRKKGSRYTINAMIRIYEEAANLQIPRRGQKLVFESQIFGFV